MTAASAARWVKFEHPLHEWVGWVVTGGGVAGALEEIVDGDGIGPGPPG